MVTNSQIGLVAWGLKLGKDVFFSNINPNEAEIVRTLEDARGIINMHRTNQVFYSIEFTPTYKVYTIYRTIIDWGNRDNAYLALSLFIKYPIVFEGGVLPVLKALVRIYEENYIDENHRIKRVQERREDFFNKLNDFACKKKQTGPCNAPTRTETPNTPMFVIKTIKNWLNFSTILF